MAKNNIKKHEILDSVTFQAVCKKGDFFGEYQPTKPLARGDAARHNAKPGCENHIVSIVQTTTIVKPFSDKK